MEIKNRWLIVISVIAIHICIGSIYSWSIYTTPLLEQMGWSLRELSLVFSLAIIFLGLTAALMGSIIEKNGPKKSGIIAALFFGFGVIGAGVAVKLSSLFLLYLSYGVLGGIGLGIGYIAPVSTLVSWFPDRRGFATGLAVMGFGFGAVISGPAQQHLIVQIGIANTLFTLGAIYLIVMSLGASYLARPPAKWSPSGTLNHQPSIKRQENTHSFELTANEAIKERRFWLLWFMFFINIACGIAVLSVASPMAMEIAGLSAAGAAIVVGVMGFFNGVGRLMWASISDYIGRPNVYTMFFIIEAIIFVILPNARHAMIFVTLLFILITCYGGGFSCILAYIADLFGTKSMGAIYGYMLTAWSVAGLAGPYFAAWIHELTGSYTRTLSIFSILFILALMLSIWIRHDIRVLAVKKAVTNV